MKSAVLQKFANFEAGVLGPPVWEPGLNFLRGPVGAPAGYKFEGAGGDALMTPHPIIYLFFSTPRPWMEVNALMKCVEMAMATHNVTWRAKTDCSM
jgi:hypothetical protein